MQPLAPSRFRRGEDISAREGRQRVSHTILFDLSLGNAEPRVGGWGVALTMGIKINGYVGVALSMGG